MEHASLWTGIGGQGVQLAAEVVARAAVLEGRHVLLFGVYAGAMRGMNTDATVVIADEPVTSPPIVSRASWAVALHDRYWGPVAAKLTGDACALVHDETFAAPVPAGVTCLRVPAARLAREVGAELTASMVMAGAFGARSGLVGLDALTAAMHEALPPYRRVHAPTNAAALEAGYRWAAAGVAADLPRGLPHGIRP